MSTPNDQLSELIHQGQIAVSERHGADLIDISHDTLRRYRRMGTGPRYVRVGGPNGPVRYLVSSLRAWLEGQTVGSRAEEVSRAS